MKRAIPSVVLFLLLAYLVSYMGFRSTHMEMREEREKNLSYVIFPKEHTWLYYFYRPVMYIDGAITGMRFHIGPHE